MFQRKAKKMDLTGTGSRRLAAFMGWLACGHGDIGRAIRIGWFSGLLPWLRGTP